MAAVGPRHHDLLLEDRAEDVVSIDHYRVQLRGATLRYITVGEINPHCDDLLSDDIAKFRTPEEGEQARDQFVAVNLAIGLPTDAVVVGLNSAGVILAVDGEHVSLPTDEDDSNVLPL